jgi:mRNA interferase MazF
LSEIQNTRRAEAYGSAVMTWSTLTVLPTSTSAQASVFRPEVVIAGRDTKVLIDQIRTIDVSYVAGDLVDYLSHDDMSQVEHSLSRYFGLLR